MKYKFELKETITFEQVQFTVSLTSVPSVKEGSEECLKARQHMEKLFKILQQQLGTPNGNTGHTTSSQNNQAPADGSPRNS